MEIVSLEAKNLPCWLCKEVVAEDEYHIQAVTLKGTSCYTQKKHKAELWIMGRKAAQKE
jgi:hypothetical protein